MTKLWVTIARLLDAAGDWVSFLGLRLLLGWEFFESGLENYRWIPGFPSVAWVRHDY